MAASACNPWSARGGDGRGTACFPFQPMCGHVGSGVFRWSSGLVAGLPGFSFLDFLFYRFFRAESQVRRRKKNRKPDKHAHVGRGRENILHQI